jgi:serine/threonine protein kinase
MLSGRIGTKIFSSPEQACSDNYDHRTDIYSLAIIAAIMFSQFTTVHEEREMIYNIRNKHLDNLKINPSLKDILIRCLSEQKFRPSLL